MTRHDVPLPSGSVRPVDGAKPPFDEEAPARPRRRRRRLISPLTRRILTVNILALAIPVAGLLYLGQYRDKLIQTELDALQTQAQIFAEALGEGAVGTAVDGTQSLRQEVARPMLRRLVQPTRSRARLFSASGTLIADSRFLTGPGGDVQIEILPPPETDSFLPTLILDIYDGVVSWLPGQVPPPLYQEKATQKAPDYREVIDALNGVRAGAVRRTEGGTLVLSAAVPVQRFKRVLGALFLTSGSVEIDRAVREVRVDILRAFGLALAVTVLLSFYLAGTVARPVRRLAAAADRVRHRGHGSGQQLPDFSGRRDEIGDLSRALRDMTQALAQRMNAIESFAADVAHEIKNPLTSLRSAVETAARVSDPDQQRRLMTIIQEDVQRLDRLISDISDASRLDAELARGDMSQIDLGRLLSALVQVYESTAGPHTPRLVLNSETPVPIMVEGIEGRLVQVFRNLISNAFSFAPADSEVSIAVSRVGDSVHVIFEDEGPGIPEGSLDKIFDRFYSERPEEEHFGEHSGLGLSISRQIIEAHRGALRAGNRYGPDGSVLGARFAVILPIVEGRQNR